MKMSSASGAESWAAAPTAWAIRPQFGSPPCSAALTSGEFATARAAATTRASGPPLTTTRPTRFAPSPRPRVAGASRRSAQSRASPKRTSSSLCGATTTPLSPDACRITVSLVESCPSTDTRSNERATHTPSSRSAVSADSLASVWTKQSIVANDGEIIPAPLACAVSRTVPDGSATSASTSFSNLSVVRMASEKSPIPCSRSSPRARAMPRIASLASSSTPITPVEATATWSSRTPPAIAAAPCMRAASSRPRRPVAALALPELTTTTRMASSRVRVWQSTTGAASTPERVNRAALTVSGEATSNPRSSPPDGFRPQAAPAMRKPAGRSPSRSPTWSGRSSHREWNPVRGVPRSACARRDPRSWRAGRSCDAFSLRPAEDEVQVLDGLRGGALPQVVDRREDEHAARARVGVHGDAAEVGVAHLEHADRPVPQLHEGLARVRVVVELAELVGLHVARRGHVAGDQLALGERQQVGRERDRHARPQGRELLLDLRRVAVPRDLVGRHVLGGGDEVRRRRRRPPGARDARLRVDHHVADRRGPRQRRQREQRGGRVAAGVGDEVRLAHRVARELRQAVHALPEVLRRAVLAVPVLVDGQVAQPEVGRQVDHQRATLAQLGHDRGGGSVRVRDHRRVHRAVRGRVVALERQRHPRAGMDVVEA